MLAAPQTPFGIDKLNLARSDAPAVTHVDCSVRIQTMNAGDHLRLCQLFSRFKNRDLARDGASAHALD